LLKDFDGADLSDMAALMGEKGQLTIIHSNEKGAIYSGQIEMTQPDVRTALARYFNQSEQIPTGVEFYSQLKDFHISEMKGLMVQKLPGADTEKFVRILEQFNGREVASQLESASGVKDFDRLFGLDDLSLLESRSLQFNCRCSYEKSVKILGMLSSCELQEIIQKKTPQRVTCHFCGETYRINTEDVSILLLEKADENKPV
jgi:molecular chaperone Hsp33